MEDQGKRLLLAVAIAFALLMVWNVVFPTKAPEKKPEVTETAETEAGDKSGSGSALSGDKSGSGSGSALSGDKSGSSEPVAEQERGEEKLVTFEFKRFRAEFSSYGGALKSWKLLGKQFEDRRVDPVVAMDLIPINDRGSESYSFQLSLGEDELDTMRQAEWAVVSQGDKHVHFRWTNPALTITKKYEIDPERFTLRLTIDIEQGTAELKHTPTLILYGFQNPKDDVGGGMTRLPREWKAACLVGDDIKSKSAKSLVEKPERRDGDIRWGGFDHSYFVAILAVDHKSDERLECDSYSVENSAGLMRVEISLPQRLVKNDTPYQLRSASYLGPKWVSALEAATRQTSTYFEKGTSPTFEEAVDLGYLGFLSGPLLWLLTIFQSFVINWGLAIIVLTLVVKLLVLPWTHKSIKSMKGMGKLRPQMERIKEKYADDRQRQQVETMNLFKTHGVNPLAGCLPMVLQMPIWFALYRMLMAAGELYQMPFIPGWIDDMTAPDPFYILPVFVTGMMFVQTRLTPTTATGLQAKVLMYGMPAMFGFFSLFFPAGLTLYIFTNTCLTLVHHYFVHAEDRAKAKDKKKAEAEGKEYVDPDAIVYDLDDDDDEADEDAKGGRKGGKSGSKRTPGAYGNERKAGARRKKSSKSGKSGKSKGGKKSGKSGKKKSTKKSDAS